jgi:hypothetical protein
MDEARIAVETSAELIALKGLFGHFDGDFLIARSTDINIAYMAKTQQLITQLLGKSTQFSLAHIPHYRQVMDSLLPLQ